MSVSTVYSVLSPSSVKIITGILGWDFSQGLMLKTVCVNTATCHYRISQQLSLQYTIISDDISRLIRLESPSQQNL